MGVPPAEDMGINPLTLPVGGKQMSGQNYLDVELPNEPSLIKGRVFSNKHWAKFNKQKRLDRPELRVVETNPYWDAPDSACEGIYEAGKEAQLEADRKVLALIPDIEEAKKQERGRIARLIPDYLHWHHGEWCFSPKKFAEFGQALKEEK